MNENNYGYNGEYSGLRLAVNVFTALGIVFLLPFPLMIFAGVIGCFWAFALLYFWSFAAFFVSELGTVVAVVFFAMPFLLFFIYLEKKGTGGKEILGMTVRAVFYAVCLLAFAYWKKTGFLPM